MLSRDGADYRILIGRPTAHPAGDYVCACALIDAGGVELWALDVGGVDEIQALTLALMMVGERLAVESPPLTFLGHDDPGFPRHGVPWDHWPGPG